MDVVSNYIGQLSASQFGNKSEGVSGNIDLNDNTFENILNNQMNKIMEQDISNRIGELGIPAGLDIGDFDGTKPIFKIDSSNNTEGVKRISESNNSQDLNMKNNDISTSEVLTFFSSVFDKKPTLTQSFDTGLFSFERKLAAGSYGKYARNIVTDLSEFVTDTIKMKS